MSAATVDGPDDPDDDLPHEAYLVSLASLDGVGPRRLRWLLSLGAPDQVWQRVLQGRLSPPSGSGVTAELIRGWRNEASTMRPSQRWADCATEGLGVVSLGSPGYPPSLRDDPDPPVVLFHRGDPDRIGEHRVAIIGTRRPTGYGVRTARRLGRELAEAGVSVVSGLALGIDGAAHRGAVEATRSTPVAVVGGGLDQPCPTRNLVLADEVAERGVLLSEVPPRVASAPWRFPVRNRILAGLAQVVVVVESAAAGGSMHTVREALARDRAVLAVPGPVDSPASEGTNRLLYDGALPCTGTDDVLLALGACSGARRAPVPIVDSRPPATGDAALVLEALDWRPSSAEQLALRSGVDFRALSRSLSWLESAGWISRRDGWIERVARPEPIPDPGGSGA